MAEHIKKKEPLNDWEKFKDMDGKMDSFFSEKAFNEK